jgi:hypothetical protein
VGFFLSKNETEKEIRMTNKEYQNENEEMKTPFEKGECCFEISHCLNGVINDLYKPQMEERNLSVKGIVEEFGDYYVKWSPHFLEEMFSDFMMEEYEIEKEYKID